MNSMKWPGFLLICLLLVGCRQASEVSRETPVEPFDEATAKAVAVFARKGFDTLRKQGVVIGKLEAYGSDGPSEVGARRVQGYALHYAATYQSRRVTVDAWIQLATEKKQTRLWRGRAAVNGPDGSDSLKVDLQPK